MATRQGSTYQDAQIGKTSILIYYTQPLSLSYRVRRPACGRGDVSRERYASPGAIMRTPGPTGQLPCVSIPT